MGQKNFLSVKVFFVCSDKSLLICVRSYNTLKLPANHRSISVFKKRSKSVIRICIFLRFFPRMSTHAIAIIKCNIFFCPDKSLYFVPHQ